MYQIMIYAQEIIYFSDRKNPILYAVELYTNFQLHVIEFRRFFNSMWERIKMGKL